MWMAHRPDGRVGKLGTGGGVSAPVCKDEGNSADYQKKQLEPPHISGMVSTGKEREFHRSFPVDKKSSQTNEKKK